MSVGLTSCKGESSCHLSGAQWYSLMVVGGEFGWEAEGTVVDIQPNPRMPSILDEDWCGHYSLNHGQRVTSTDASRLATALEHALQAARTGARDSEEIDPVWQKFKILGPLDAVRRFGFEGTQEVIDLCRAGDFLIT